MSDHIIKIIPTDPMFCCDEQTAERVTAYIRSRISSWFQGEPLSVEYSLHENPMFVDCASNLESITCPFCGKTLDFGWWGSAMDLANKTSFRNLEIILPCCRQASSLNCLNYDFDCGFSRVEFDLYNPASVPDSDCIHTIEELLCITVKIIKAHL